MPHTFVKGYGRSIGLADMAYAIRSGRPHRANGELANHVLEVMDAFEKSSTAETQDKIQTTCERPAMLPLGLAANELEA
jgi:hypothetical protein